MPGRPCTPEAGAAIELLCQGLHTRNADGSLASESTRRKSPIVRERSRLSGNVGKPREAAASGLSNPPSVRSWSKHVHRYVNEFVGTVTPEG